MSPGKGARRLLSADGGVWSLNIAIVIASVALLAGPVQHLPEFDAGVHLPWWALALGFLVAERCVVHLHFRRSAHSFSLGDLPLVFGLVFATRRRPRPRRAASAPSLTLLLDRRLPPIKLVFNLAQFALAACLGVDRRARARRRRRRRSGPRLWVARATSRRRLSALRHRAADRRRDLARRGPAQAATLGADVRDGLRRDADQHEPRARRRDRRRRPTPRALPLLLVPALTVFLAYRAYAAERQRHERLEFLYEATRTLSRSPEIVAALEGLLARSLEAFRAEIAEIVLFSSDGSPPLRTTLGPGDYTRGDGADRRRDRRGAARAGRRTTSPVVRARRARSAAARLRRYLEARGVTDAMLAMLPGEDARDRHDHARQPLRRRSATFSDDDLRLFETLANNASVALQYDRLEQAVLQLRELQEQLHHQAYHDPLTDLANRTLFIDRVKEALASRTPARSRCCSSTSTTSRPSTTRSATPSATSCWSRSPSACAPACARPTPSRASAATSSP